MIAAMFTGDVLVMVMVTGLVLIVVLVVVARRTRLDKQISATGWAQYQASLYDTGGQSEHEQTIPAAVTGAVAQPAIGGRQPSVSVTSVRDLPAAPAAALTAGPAPAPPASAGGQIRPRAGDRVKAAGGRWGYVQSLTQPAAGMTRFYLRMDDGAAGYVDVPDDADVLAEPLDPYAAAREEARAAAERARATTHPAAAPSPARIPVRPPARPAAASAAVPQASTVSVGGFTIPCADAGARS